MKLQYEYQLSDARNHILQLEEQNKELRKTQQVTVDSNQSAVEYEATIEALKE